MAFPDNGARTSSARQWAWAAVVLVALAALAAVAWRYGWLSSLANQAQLRAWMREGGAAGPLICIGIQFLQVVFFAFPGEFTQIAAGYVFGAWWGFAYSIPGILLGSAFAFAFARNVGRPAVERFVGRERLDRIDRRLKSRRGRATVFFLFLLPGLPKDAMCYAAGLGGLRLAEFIFLSVPARAPALLLSTLFGSEAHDGDYASMVWIATAATLLLIGAVYYHRRHRAK